MTDVKTAVVPVEPTTEMLLAADNCGRAMAGSDLTSSEMTEHIWSAMLAAAPAPLPGGLEYVARVIDPDAFGDMSAEKVVATADRRSSALRKAKDILALLGSRPSSPVAPTEQAEGAVVGWASPADLDFIRSGSFRSGMIWAWSDPAHDVPLFAGPPVVSEGPRCQMCGDEVEGWTCQGCGRLFRENSAGVLVMDANHQAPTPASVSPGTEGE